MPYKSNKRYQSKKKKNSGTAIIKIPNAALAKKVQESKERFLNAYLESDGNVTLSADEVGIDRTTHYNWMEKDLEYAAKFIAFQKAVEERGKQVFILAYKKCNFSITKAAEMIGICRDKHYEWLKDEKYAEQFRNAHDQMGDILEAEGYRRAVEGWDEPVWNKDGFLCGYIRKYSDSLLLKMLPANKERYKEKQTEVNIHNNVNVQLADAMDAARERLINANIQNRIGTSQ